jgi:hypothetical protein
VNTATVEEAKVLAQRLVERAEAWEKARAEAPKYAAIPRESGALRRASMDLTRALADLRRPS